LLAESKLTFGLIEYPYELNSSHLIGYHYYNNVLTGANTGWLGSGYMHFGFAGMLIYAVIIGLLLGLVDMLCKKERLEFQSQYYLLPFSLFFYLQICQRQC
jgi:hypothetical protein